MCIRDRVLLEPIVSMKVSVPDKYTGDVMGDLNKRRGRVLGMNPDADRKGNTVIEADVPMPVSYTHLFMVVDFPAPFGPRKPYTVPFLICRFKSDTAVKFL